MYFFCARVGADSNGQRLRTIYREAGIDSRFYFYGSESSDRGLLRVVDKKMGQNQIIVFPGTNSIPFSD